MKCHCGFSTRLPVERDPKALDDYEEKLALFLAEVDIKVQSIRTLTDMKGQLEAAVAR